MMCTRRRKQGDVYSFNIMTEKEDAKHLALNLLCMMTGITIRDGERFPRLPPMWKRSATIRTSRKGCCASLKNYETPIQRSAMPLRRTLKALRIFAHFRSSVWGRTAGKDVRCQPDVKCDLGAGIDAAGERKAL